MQKDGEKEMLYEQVEQLKKSNERLERAFLAISALLESKFSEGVAREKEQKDALSLEFSRKLKRNRGALIKEKIMEQVQNKGEILLSDLKFLLVDQLNYTSKPSFYRYMKELYSEDMIIRSEANGKVFITQGREMLIKNKL